MRGIEAGRLGVGEKRPCKLEFDGVASGIDQAELPRAMDFNLPCEDFPSRFFVG